jgi:transcriptional regulator GlxA family with amidase domain
MPSKTLPTPDQPAVRVVVVAFDGISPFHLAVPCVVFGDRHPGVAPFDFRVCAVDRRLRTTVGFELRVDRGLAALRRADVVIVPSWRDPAEKPPEALTQALRAAHGRGARLVGLCLGAYPLAATGLLDGRRATTHWSVADDFAQRFAAVQVDREVLYVDEGDVVTSAGTAAGMDCCLHILRQLRGAEAANRVARHLVIAPHRAGGQAQFIEQPVPVAAADTRLARVLEQATHDLAAPHTVDSMAAMAAMSRRSFTRHFRLVCGTTPMAWLAAQRLAQAQRLLEQSELSIDAVAEAVGMGTAAALRQQFRQQIGVSPTAWRKSFAHRAGR